MCLVHGLGTKCHITLVQTAHSLARVSQWFSIEVALKFITEEGWSEFTWLAGRPRESWPKLADSRWSLFYTWKLLGLCKDMTLHEAEVYIYHAGLELQIPDFISQILSLEACNTTVISCAAGYLIQCFVHVEIRVCSIPWTTSTARHGLLILLLLLLF